MLTSHNLRMLNPAVSQTPLLQNIKAAIPLHYICSKTIKIGQYVWVDSYDEHVPAHEQDQANLLNDAYLKTQCLELERKTEMVDPLLHCLNVFLNNESTLDSLSSITPAPCPGLYNEVVEREKLRPMVLLSPQQIEFRPDRCIEHGRMIKKHEGVLKTFNLPCFDSMPKAFGPALDKQYVIMEFELLGFNVATGMLGLGLPPVTLLGTFFNNYLSRDLNCSNIKFAIGITQLRPVLSNLTPQISPYRQMRPTQRVSRKANIQGCIVFDVDSDSTAQVLMAKLGENFRIAKTPLSYKRVWYDNVLPKAYWMSDMSKEVQQRIQEHPKKDALDVAFDFYEENRLFAPVSSGFALFDEPVLRPHMDNLRYRHSWAESVFTCTELIYGEFKRNYFYKRSYGDLFLVWEQDL